MAQMGRKKKNHKSYKPPERTTENEIKEFHKELNHLSKRENEIKE